MNYNHESMKSELLQYLKQIQFAKDCAVAYGTMINVATDYNDLAHEATGFFMVVKKSLSHSIDLEVAKLYGRAKDEKNLQKLLRIVEANQNVFKECMHENGSDFDFQNWLNNVKNRLEEFYSSSYLENIKFRRDKVVAHSDKEFYEKEDVLRFTKPIYLNNIHDLLNFAYEICTTLLKILTPNCVYNYSYAPQDLEKLFLAFSQI